MRLRKTLSIILAICMVFSSVSFAYAAEIPAEAAEQVAEIEEKAVEVAAETTETVAEAQPEETKEVAEATEVKTEEPKAEAAEVTATEAPAEEPKQEIKVEEAKADEAKAEAAEDIVLTAELEDIVVTLKASADAFDNKGELSLKVTPVEITESEEKALDEKETENVAKRLSYDITVLDEGEEIEPVKEVDVSFELKAAPSGADGLNIFHHDETDGIEKIATEVLNEAPKTNASTDTKAAAAAVVAEEAKPQLKAEDKTIEIKDVTEEELAETDDVELVDDVTVKAIVDGFSVYTVDFTYKDKTISIAGDSTGNKLDDIVAQLGINEDVEEATTYQDAECTEEVASGEVKDEGKTLFTVYESGDEWYVDAVNAFETEHGLIVKTADGAEYKIKVTDDAAPVIKYYGTTASGIKYAIPANVRWGIGTSGNLFQEWDDIDPGDCVYSKVFSGGLDAEEKYPNIWTDTGSYDRFEKIGTKRVRNAVCDNGEVKKNTAKFVTYVVYYKAPDGMKPKDVHRELYKLVTETYPDCGDKRAICTGITKSLAAVDTTTVSLSGGILSFKGIDDTADVNGYDVNLSNENNNGSGTVHNVGADGYVRINLNEWYGGEFVSTSVKNLRVIITTIAHLERARSSEDVTVIYVRKTEGGEWSLVDSSQYDGEWDYGAEKPRYKLKNGTFAADMWSLYVDDGFQWYFLGADTYLVTNAIVDSNGEKYYVNEGGVRADQRWIQLNGEWYYAMYDGRLVKGPAGGYAKRTIAGKEYAFDENAKLVRNKSYLYIGGNIYSADNEGVLTQITSGGGSSSGGGGGGGGGGSSVASSGSSTTVKGAKTATTPIVKAANGTQTMGTSVASTPITALTAEVQKTVYGKGGQTGWVLSNGSYQLKDGAGNLVKNRWALVSDNLSSSGIGNVSSFYFDENGNMLIGWQWIKDADGLWRQYFLNDENGPLLGACLIGGTKDGKTLNEKGQVVVNGVVQAFATKPAS